MPCTLYFGSDLVLNMSPNFFKKHFIKNLTYLECLNNNHIVSCHIVVKFSTGTYRTLGVHFGYKFNYDELIN